MTSWLRFTVCDGYVWRPLFKSEFVMFLIKIGYLIAVGLLWGSTNPIIKRNSRGIVDIQEKNSLKRFLLELKYLLTNYEYLLPMVFNQLGSLLYFLALQNNDLSLASPIVNSLSLVFTALTGWILGEKIPKKRTITGIILILIGTSLCLYDKS